ncbi:hypothetical protein TWF281_004099 [Arthrobotrys megalospora]
MTNMRATHDRTPSPEAGRVGITIPLLSNKVFWYDKILTVKDLLGAVCRQNPILDGKRISIMLDGKRAQLYDHIKDATVVTAEFFTSMAMRKKSGKPTITKITTDAICMEKDDGTIISSDDLKPASSDNAANPPNSTISTTNVDPSDQGSKNSSFPNCKFYAVSGTTHKSFQSAPKPKEHPSYDGFQDTRSAYSQKIMINFNLEGLGCTEAINIAATDISTVSSIYLKARAEMIQKSIIHPQDEIKYQWTQTQNIVRAYERLYDILADIPARLSALEVSVTKVVPKLNKPVEIEHTFHPTKTKSFLPASRPRTRPTDAPPEPKAMHNDSNQSLKILPMAIPKIHQDILDLLSDLPNLTMDSETKFEPQVSTEVMDSKGVELLIEL